MATALFAWELGDGLSHVAEMLPLVKGLRDGGHKVIVALRNFSQVARYFAETGAECLTAPDVPAACRWNVGPPGTLPYVLAEAGFTDLPGLHSMTEAWTKLFDSALPNLIVFDHSPRAMLAAWGRPVKRVLLGNGFCCPADCSPLPDLRTGKLGDLYPLQSAERAVLQSINRLLSDRDAGSLTRLAQLYETVDDVLLTTLAEFDPYQRHGPRRYRGPWIMPSVLPPTWPAGGGKRVFAYLRLSPDLPRLLNLLCHSDHRLIIAGKLDPRLQKHFQRANVRFESRPLDLARVAAECDAAVLNGNHTTTLIMLLAGKPVLQVPLLVEQGLNARATVELGAGLSTFPNGIERVREQLADLSELPRYTDAARRFAAKYSSFSRSAEISTAVSRLEELLSCADRPRSCLGC